MAQSIVELPADVGYDFQVYLNGVPQYPDRDFQIDGRTLIFERPLRTDRVSGWRWFLGAWGVGTYRQDDTIDIRYEINGNARLAHAVPIKTDPHSDPTGREASGEYHEPT
jgi:hypothetical protein